MVMLPGPSTCLEIFVEEPRTQWALDGSDQAGAGPGAPRGPPPLTRLPCS